MRRPPVSVRIRVLVPLLLGLVSTSALAAPNALRFNGSTQYVTFGLASSLNASTFTIECWFKREGAGVATSTGSGGTVGIPLIAKGRADADANTRDANYFLGIRGDSIIVADYEEGTGQASPGLNHPIAGITKIRNDVWYHVAATFDGSHWRLYLNGEIEKDTTLTGARLPQSSTIEHASIASALTSASSSPPAGPAGFFQGVIEEPRIWNVSRAQQGIRDSMGLQFATAPGLIGRWALDEGTGTTAASTVAGAPSGTLSATSGALPSWVSGGGPFTLPTAALQFGGTNAYVAFLNNPPSLKLSQFTIETWFRRDGAGVGTNTGSGGIGDLIPLVAKGRAESENPAVDINYIFGIRASTNVLCADFEEGAGGDSLSLNHPVHGITAIPANGAWHHGAVTYDGHRWKLYLDGSVEKDTLIDEPAGSGSDVSISLGSALNSSDAASGFFNGAMDETRIWNRARTQAEIIADLNNQITAAQSDLVARWGLNEGAGTLIRGSAGTSINGTLTGSNYFWIASAPFNLTPPSAPNGPTGFTATGETFASVRLQWVDASSNESGFEILRSTTGPGGTFSPVATLAANTTSFVDAGLAEDTEYCYQVRAFNGVGSNTTVAQCTRTLVEGSSALALAGTNAYADLGKPASLNLPQFTLECWFRKDGAGVGTNTGGTGIPDLVPLIAKGRAESEVPERDINYIFGIRASDGVLCADFEEAANGPQPSENHPIAGDATIATGAWHHAACTYDGNLFRLYLDGNLEREQPIGRPVASDDTIAVALGSALNSAGTASGFFHGAMDEVRIWNYARTIAQIQSAINTEIESGQTGLVGRWGLNEAAAGTVNGGAGTGINGAIRGTGFSWTTPGAPFGVPAPTAPQAPTSLSATALTEGQIQLSWVDNSSNELVFEIERSDTGPSGTFAPIGTVSANTRTYVDTGLEQLTQYCYQVRASNPVGPSAYTLVKCATTPAEPNKALDLGGSDAYVSFGDPSALKLPAFTLECWFRRDGSGATASTGSGGVVAVPLVTKGVDEAENSTLDLNFFLGIRGTDGVLVADFEEGRFGDSPGRNHPVIGATPVTNGTWYHAAATYDGSKWQLFLDGNLEREATVNEPPQSLSIQRAAIGSALSSQGAPFGYYDGAIDEVRIWNYARTPAQILQTINDQIIAAQTGLVARWSLNEGTGTLIHGSAGTSAAGSLLGDNWSWIDGAPFDVPPPTEPQAPDELSANAPSFSQVNLSWVDQASNELAFEIYRSTTGPSGTFTPLDTVPSNTLTYVDTDVNELSQYCYQVRATNSVGPSSFTTVRCASTPAEPSHSLDFGGAGNAYVTFGDPDALDLKEFTVEAWFRRDGPGTLRSTGSGGFNCVPIVTHGTAEVDDTNQDMNFHLGIDADTGVIGADLEEGAEGVDPGLNHPVLGHTPIQDGVWYHAAAAYDGNRWRLYLNGELETEAFVGQLPRWNTIQPAAIASGIQSDGTAQGFFNGRIDEVRIWDHDRTEAEIQATIDTQIKTPQPGLVARWGLNEGAGTTVGGSAGTAITGTITGSDWTWADAAPFDIVIQHPPGLPDQPSPADEATHVSTSPTLSVRVTDPDPGNLTVTFFGRAVAGAAGPDFTLIGLPDTQFYTSSKNGGTPAILDAQTNWIVQNKAARNVVDVIQLGDCTDDGDSFESEWQNADRSFGTIENPSTTGLLNGIPYGICVGNHDQSPNGDAAGTTTFYNQYFGTPRFNGRGYYGGHFGSNNDNHYHLFSASGMDFIVISMEYDPQPDVPVLAWCGGLLRQFSNRRAIIASHYIINSGNPGTFGTQGQAIYDTVKAYPNVFLMLCGHVSPPEGRRVDTFNGHTIHTLMSDYQGRTRGGDGWLRIYEFSPANNVIRARTYSPTLNQFETDADSSSQFTLPYDMGGGAPYQVIATRTNVVSGTTVSAPWAGLNAAAQYDWYVAVSDGGRTTTSDVFRFTTQDIVNPTVVVTSPNGGESWLTSSHHNIAWTATDNNRVDSVRIEVSTNGGANYATIASGLSNTGTYDWLVPSTPVGSQNRIRVSAWDPTLNVGSDVSNANFTITDADRPTVSLTIPDGGESWPTGSTQTITWSATDNVGVSSVDLAVSTNGGTSFTNIATSLPNTGSRQWTVPNTPSTTARVRIIARDAAGNTARDSSASNFSIVDTSPPSVALTAPNGGESWGAGSSHDITWTASDNVAVTAIDLRYSTDGGATFPNAIATGITNSGTFAWTVPASPGSNTRVKVIARDAAALSAADSSDASFTITPEGVPPTVTVTAPNTAVSWATGTHHNITWTASDASGIASVDIALYTNSGADLVGVVATGLTNAGTFDWLVASSVASATMRIRVTATDGSGNVAFDISNVNFTITDGDRPAVNLTVPDGGETWGIGTSQTITWSATDNVGVSTVDLAFSTNGGSTFTNIVTGITNTGTRAWTIPNNPSTNARVRVIARDAAGNIGRDSSALSFTIADVTPPVVTLSSPNGGESWAAATSHNITWTATDNIAVMAVDLKYSTDGGATYPNAIATGITNSGSFAWTVPNAIGNAVRVSVAARDAAANAGSDSSAANFAITPEGVAPQVTVNAPNTAVTWPTGTHQNITWLATDNTSVQSIDIDLSTNGGSTFPTNLATGIANTGTFEWLVASSVVGSANRIRVTAHDPYNNAANDVSNVNFTITDGTAPAVALTIPDGGEVWNIGSSQTITWTASDNIAVASVDLALSTNGGASFGTAIASAIANSGSRAWTIPNTPSTAARVRIIARDAAGNTARDSSSLDFTIVDNSPPVVSLLAPDGGEGWAQGSSHAITWSASDNVAVTGIDLRYSTDGGASFPDAIATNIANSGSFNWTVPATLGTAYRVKVVARDAANQSASDSSGTNFTVSPEAVLPTVAVVSPNGGESWATGSHHDITWSASDASGIASVDLAYSTNGGSTYPNTIATGLANSGAFDWAVPTGAVGNAFRVRVTATDNNNNVNNDASNTNFTVADGQPPTVSLTAPDGGESFDAGASQTITWTASDLIGVTSVDLAYSTNAGASFPNVIATGIANTGSRAWTIPATPSAAVRVRVIARDAAGNVARDSSTTNFSIVDGSDPVVTLNSPNGGQSWGRGSAQSITWSASDNVGVTAIDLAYSTDGGATYPNAIASNLANTGSFAWTVPNDLSSTMRVRVTAHDAAGHAKSDASDANFAIIVDPDLVANGGFESNINGWINYGSATLSQGNEGHTGTHCLQIVGSSSFGCDDDPNNVPATGAVGAIYRISCWVRSPNSSGGTLKIRVYEYVGSSQQGSTAYSNQPTATTSWQLLTLDYTVRSANSYLSIRVTGSSSGTFLVDDVSIKRLSGPQPNAPPVVVSPANVNGTAGSPLSFQVTASDPDGPALTSLTQSGKPSAATFSAPSPFTTGTFTWTPAASDVRIAPYVVIFTASNTQSGRDTTNIVVGPAVDRPPVVTAPATVSGGAGFPINFSVTASDPDGQTFTFGQSGKPAAATFTVNSATSATFSWTPTAADVSATPYEVTFTAINALQGSALTRITVGTAPPNLIGNPDFESGTGGWGTYGNAILTTVPADHSGNALQVTGSSSFGADDDPNSVPGPLRQGAVYRVSCYVKAVGSAHGEAKIRVYEYLGTSQQGSTAYSQIVPLSSSWQFLTLDYTVRVQGTYLSIRITDAPSSGTESFLVDDVSIVQLGPGALVAGQLEAPVTPRVDATPLTFAAWFAPNPMQASGTLNFTTTRVGSARVEIFDIHGRLVRGLLDEQSLAPGTHRLAVDARGLRGGLYFYRIQAGEGRIQGRFVLAR